MDRRLRFVRAIVGSLLVIALVLILVDVLTYRLFFVFSYISFLGLSYAYRMHRLPQKPRWRLLGLALFGGFVVAAIVADEILHFLGVSLLA